MTSYKKGFIYNIFLLEDPDIRYIGSSLNDRERARWQTHKQDYTKYKKNSGLHNVSIYEYFDKYGIEKFKFQVLKKYDVCDKRHLEAYEQLYINKLKCVNKNSAFCIKRLASKQYREDNKEQIAQRERIYRENNKEKIAQRDRIYRENNKEKIAQKDRIYRENNKEKIAQKDRIYNEKNKEVIAKKRKEYYEKNKEKISDECKKSYAINREQILQNRKTKMMCECGKEILKVNLCRHKKSKQHQNNKAPKQ